MIILNCSLILEESVNMRRILNSIVYDNKSDRFIKIRQEISVELTLGISGAYNGFVNITDVVRLDKDKIIHIYKEEELPEIFKIVEDAWLSTINSNIPNSFIDSYNMILKAKDFIVYYKRNKKIEILLQNEI